MICTEQMMNELHSLDALDDIEMGQQAEPPEQPSPHDTVTAAKINREVAGGTPRSWFLPGDLGKVRSVGTAPVLGRVCFGCPTFF